MARSAARARTRTTMSVSVEFADMVSALAKSHRLSIQEFCDQRPPAQWVDEYRTLLATKSRALRGSKTRSEV